MRRLSGRIGWLAGVLLLAAGTLIAPGRSWAQTTANFNLNNSVAIDGLTFKLTSCSVNSVVVTGNGACGTNLEMMAFAGRGAHIEVLNQTVGQDIHSGTTSYALSYTFTVTNGSVTNDVTLFGSTMTGSANAAVSLTDTLVNSVGGATVATQSLNLSSGSPSSTSTAFGGINRFSISNNLSIGASAGGLKLTNITQYLAPAPEPVSVGLFGVGVAGIALVRRRRRRLV